MIVENKQHFTASPEKKTKKPTTTNEYKHVKRTELTHEIISLLGRNSLWKKMQTQGEQRGIPCKSFTFQPIKVTQVGKLGQKLGTCYTITVITLQEQQHHHKNCQQGCLQSFTEGPPFYSSVYRHHLFVL